MLRVYLHYKPVIRTSPIYKITDFEWVPITLLLALLVITILRILIFFYRRKKQTSVRMSVFSWQRYKDSNLKWRSQSPECYRYTIPLYISVGKAVSHYWIILAYSEEVVKKKWEFLSKKFGSSQRRRSAVFINGKFFAYWCGFWRSVLHNRRIFDILKQEIPAGSGIIIFAARPALFS